MKKTIIISFIFFISCQDIGKNYNWHKDLPGFYRSYGSIGYDYGWSAAFSPFDQGIILSGQRTPNIAGQSDLWVIKTDNRGIMEWERKFGGSRDDAGLDVIATSDGSFLLVGYSWSFGNEQQIYVIKLDFYGNLLWEKNFGGSMWDVGSAVIEVSDGGYIIAGHSNSPGISSGNSDVLLIKLDIDGNLLWMKSHGNQAFPNHEWAYDLLQTDNEDLIVVGSRDRYYKGSKNGLVYRLDKNGKLIWEKEMYEDGQISESIYSISKSNNGDYYLCLSTNSSESVNIYQPKIIKMDGSGNIDWQRILLSRSKDYHQFRATTTLSGDLVIAGSSSQDSVHKDKENAFLTKMNSSGKIIWSYPYGSLDEDDWGWSVFETPSTNLVLVGSTKSFGSSLFDVFLVGTNPDGIAD